MSDPINFKEWSDDQLREYALSGKMPEVAAPAPTQAVGEAPPGMGAEVLRQRNEQAMRRAYPQGTGSFAEGFKGQLASPGLGVARMFGGEEAEGVAQQHGAEMERQRATPMGALGSTAANVLTGVGLMPATGYLASMGAGAGLEGLSDYGEGKSGVEGAIRGGAGGFLGNWLANTVGTLGNVAWKAAGKTGRWDDKGLEHVYDFAKSKGVDLRPGDISGGLHAGFENLHAGSTGNAGLENQADQIYKSIFGAGDKNEITAGLARVDAQMAQAKDALWKHLDQFPDKTTVTPTGLLTALEQAGAEYPKILRTIDNARLKEKLLNMVKQKQDLVDQGYTAAQAHRMTAFNNEMTFDEVREILKKVINPQQLAVQTKVAKGKMSPYSADEVNNLKSALNGDLRRWGQQNPDKYKAYNEVLDVYKRDFVPYDSNPLIVNWKAKEYDGNPERLVSDLLNPAKQSQRDNLVRDYLSKIDRDTTGYIEMLRVADRGGKVIAHGAKEEAGGIPSMLSPAYTAARMASHKGAGKTWMTPITGASNRIFSTEPGVLSRAAESGLRGGLGLSWQEIAGRKD